MNTLIAMGIHEGIETMGKFGFRALEVQHISYNTGSYTVFACLI